MSHLWSKDIRRKKTLFLQQADTYVQFGDTMTFDVGLFRSSYVPPQQKTTVQK